MCFINYINYTFNLCYNNVYSINCFFFNNLGVMNIIGRILSGVLANMKKVNALVLNNIALFIAAVALFLQPLCTKYFLLVVFGVVFGLCVGMLNNCMLLYLNIFFSTHESLLISTGNSVI